MSTKGSELDRISIRARHTIRAYACPELVKHLSNFSEDKRVDELIALANKAVIAGLASRKLIIHSSALNSTDEPDLSSSQGIQPTPLNVSDVNDVPTPRLSKEKAQAAFGIPKRGH